MSTVRFALRHDKKDANGLIPLELVYQISGKRGYHHFKKKTLLENWDPENSRLIFYNSKAAKKLFPLIDPGKFLPEARVNDINYAIEGIKKEIQRIEDEFGVIGRPPYSSPENEDGYLPKDVIQKLSGRPLPSYRPSTAISKSIIGIIQELIDEQSKDLAPGSLNIYRNVKRFLLDYQVKNGEVAIEQIDESFFKRFKHFLNSEKKIGDVTTFRTLSCLKTVLKSAKKTGSPVSESYKDFEIRRPELEVTSLTKDEFLRIYELDLAKKPGLEKVRDVFIFSCVTGLRYSDLASLRRHHIKKDFIEISIKKTKKILPVEIPQTKFSRAILEKYKNDQLPIPVFKNPVMNRYLKEIGELAGMDEEVEKIRFRGNKKEETIKKKSGWLTVHVGRKTFGSLGPALGIPAELVMKAGGWEDARTYYKRYLTIEKQHLYSTVNNAWDGLKAKPKSKTKHNLKNKLKIA